MVQEALLASANLAKKGVKARVINMHTIRPIDEKAVIAAARQAKALVVCEEHMVTGGLCSAVDEVVAENSPLPVRRIGVKNRFGQSGEPQELMKEYSLTSADIEAAVLEVLPSP
jgi:transketolase